MSRFLDGCREYLKEHPSPFTRTSEIRGENEPETLELSPANRCVNVYSVAKTFTMTALGLLFDRGLFDPSEYVCDILAEEIPKQGMDERWRLTTGDMALRHEIGLNSGFLDIDCYDTLSFTEDYLNYMMTFPLAYTPGTDRLYTDGAFYLLARIAEKRAGMPMEKFLWQELFGKLGFREAAFSHDPRGHAIGATGLYIHSSAMAKLGAVYLHGGCYHGERILSEKWTKLAVDRSYALDSDSAHTCYGKGGMHGQRLFVIPGQDRVLAIQSLDGDCGLVCDWAMKVGYDL